VKAATIGICTLADYVVGLQYDQHLRIKAESPLEEQEDRLVVDLRDDISLVAKMLDKFPKRFPILLYDTS
jgi:hypothetical protein